MKTRACEQCPWRLANHGKPSPGGFYTKGNLRRLWNQVRGGGNQQSCHLTDPAHPAHIAAGAKPGATAQECPGSVILIIRELKRIEELGGGVVSPEALTRYHAERKKGITKREGVLYWIVQRIQFGHVPLLGGPPLPSIPDDPAIGLPEELRG